MACWSKGRRLMGIAHKTQAKLYNKVWREHYGAKPKGMHIHHIDNNPYNNDITNLQLVTPKEHGKIHDHDGVSWASVAGLKGGHAMYNSLKNKTEWHIKGGKASKNPGGYSMSEQGKLNIKEARLNSKKYKCCDVYRDGGNHAKHMKRKHV